MMVRIKSCECGNYKLRLVEDAYEQMYKIHCPGCGKRTLSYESINDAVENWNQGFYEEEGDYISFDANVSREPENKREVSDD